MLRAAFAVLAGVLLAVPSAARAQDAPRPALVQPKPGHYSQAWFAASTFDLRRDLEDAARQGKRLVIVWEKHACPSCEEMHKVHLSDPETAGYVAGHFHVVQLDKYGGQPVRDFDGEVLSELVLARKYGVTATPTLQFLPESPDKLAGKRGRYVDVARMPGLYKPFAFRTLFEYVAERGYEQAPFPRFMQGRVERLRAEGREPNPNLR